MKIYLVVRRHWNEDGYKVIMAYSDKVMAEHAVSLADSFGTTGEISIIELDVHE